MRDILRAARRIGLAALVLLAAACAGPDDPPGSPSTGGTGTTGGTGAGGLAITPAALGFSALQNSWVPASQRVAVTFTASDAAYVVAGYPLGSAEPTWLDMGLTGYGKSWTLELRITSTALEPGTYSATVRVVIARSDESIIDVQDAEVTYTVRTGVVVQYSGFVFNYVWGSTERPSAMGFDVQGTPGLPFEATADQPWVTLAGASGVVASGYPHPAVQVSVDPSALAIGEHDAVVTVAGGEVHDTVNVALNVKAPMLSMYTGGMSLDGIAGKSLGDHGGETLRLDTGSNAYPFTASASAPWLGITPASWNVSAAGTYVSLSGNPATLPPGAHAASAEFTATVNGVVVTFAYPVTFSLAAPAITSTPATLALGGAAGQAVGPVTAQVRIDTGANAFPFSVAPASSGASWLSVTSPAATLSGSNVTISVSADASALGAGTHTSAVELTVDVNGTPVTRSIPVTLTLT